MSAPCPAPASGDDAIDVRDMLCAQALAVVARALASRRMGEALMVSYGTEDVQRDLMTWAQAQGHAAHAAGDGVLRIARGR